MMNAPEFVAAEVAYRTQRLTAHFGAVRRQGKLRARLHLPFLPGRPAQPGRTFLGASRDDGRHAIGAVCVAAARRSR